MKKIESKINEFTVQEVEVVIPPDGGYAWVIVLGAFMSNFVVNGITFSFGVSMLSPLSDVLNLAKTKIANISSAQLGLFYICGPIACAFINRFGCRAVGVCGSLISITAILVASFVESYPVIISFYGVIGGIGFGMIYTASIICVEYNFEKYRALSTGIAVSGTSVGALCLSPLFAYIVKNKGWDFTMRVQAGLLNICLVSSIAYRPLKPTQVPLTEEIFTEIDQLASPSRAEVVELYKTHSMVSIDDMNVPSDNRRPTSLRILPISETVKKNKRKRFPRSCLRNVCSTKRTNGNEKRNVIRTGPMDRKDICYSASVIALPEYKMMKANESTTNSKHMLSYHFDSKTIQSSIPASSNAPIMAMRKNIICCCCDVSQLIRIALKKLFDVSLLKSFVFCILELSHFCYGLAWLTPYDYLPLRGEMNNIPESYITWFVSSISIGNALGRISSGVLPTIFSHLNPCYMVGCAKIVGGTMTIISALIWTDSAYFQMTYCVIFGFCIAFLSAMRPVVFVNLLGLDKLTNAFGLSAVAMGVGALTGLPIASALFVATGSLLSSFVLSGSLFILCGIFMILAFRVYLLQEDRKINKK